MATRLYTEPETLLAPDLEETIERLWSESLPQEPTPHGSHSSRIRRRVADSFREFAVFDPKQGTLCEYLPMAEHGEIPSDRPHVGT